MSKTKVKNLFKKTYKYEPTYYYFAPGRVNIIGEHIDYNGGKVLPMAISLGIYAGVSFHKEKIVNAISKGFNMEPISFEINKTLVNANDFTKYIKGVIYVLKAHNYIQNLEEGFDIALVSTLPASSGLSSSACLELLILHILNDHFNLNIDNLTLVKLAQEAENKFVGVSCGIMDQFAIGMAKENKAIFLDTNKLEYRYVDFNLPKATLVIINTNKPRNLSESKYNERRSECDKALSILQKHYPKDSLCSFTLDELNEVKLDLEPIIYKRAYHAITEEVRVEKAIVAMEENDLVTLGKLLNSSHESLKKDYEVTGLHLDTIVSLLQMYPQVLGARMTGAGFGGCAIALIIGNNHLEINEIMKEISIKYQEITGIKLDYYMAESSVIRRF